MSEPASGPLPLLRRMTGRDPDEEKRASTPLELLFDLTFVVAVARAAAELREALDHGDAGHALAGYAIVFFGLWWAWVNHIWLHGLPGLRTARAAGLLLVFALWWSYVQHSAAERIRESLRWTFGWVFGHYLIFGAVAALGAGLQVVVATLAHDTKVGPVFAAFTVAIPVAVYSVMLGLLTHTSGDRAGEWLILLTTALVLVAAVAAPVGTLEGSIVIMAALVILVLAYHLATAPRPAAQPEQAAA